MGIQQFLDPGGQEFALVEDGAEGSGEAGHDECSRIGAGNDDGLLVQSGEDVLDQALGHPRGLRTYEGDQPSASGFAYLGRGSEPFQQHQDGRVLDARAHNSLQVRVDLGQQPAEPVRDPGGLTSEVVVEAHDHLQFGDGLVFELEGAEGVRHRPGRVRDDERVPRIGLGLAGIEIGDPPHRQPGEVGDLAARIAGHGQWQGADGGGLVDHDEYGAVLRDQLGEHLAELGFAVGQPLVEGLLPGRGQRRGVVFAFADVQAEEGADVTGVDHVHSPVVRPRPYLRHQLPASTLRRASQLPEGVGGVMPLISGLPVPPGAVTPPPGSCEPMP